MITKYFLLICSPDKGRYVGDSHDNSVFLVDYQANPMGIDPINNTNRENRECIHSNGPHMTRSIHGRKESPHAKSTNAEGGADPSRQRYTILLPGIPVSSNRGALGWSTVALIETGGLRILFDTGSYGDRSLLIERLQALPLDPQALDAVFISHLHYDHCQNIDLFGNVPLLVSERELRYVLDGEYRERRDPYVPATTILESEGPVPNGP